MERHADLIELLQAQIAAQRFANPCHHRAQNRSPVVDADLREHHPYNGLVLIPPRHVGLTGG